MDVDEASAAPASDEPKKDLFTVIQESVQEALDAPAAADAELIFVGTKNSGKSTMVQAFLQKEEQPKPSTPLEYKYARRSVGANSTVVANVWELGGGVTGTSQLDNLLKVVLLPELLSRSVVAIVLDMSEPERAVTTLQMWLDKLRGRVDAMQQELNTTSTGSKVAAQARKVIEEMWKDHPDFSVEAVEAVQPVGIPIVVLAHKYDAFEQAYTEGEHRKTLCRTLRFLAHQAGASLICTRHKEKQSMTLLRNMLYHHVFHTSAIDGRLLQLEHARPLVVAASADSFGGIGKPPTVQGCMSDLTADKWRAVFEEYFPPPKESRDQAQDLTMVEAEQFAEEGIDEMRRQKREELIKMRKAAEFEAKMSEAEGAARTAA
jgi:dynein light intermediate chain 2